MEFAGRVIGITGGASGIGRAAADCFAERGASVALLDRDASGAERAAAELTAAGASALGLGVDVAREDQVTGALERVVEQYGRVDFLFANAGVHRFGSVLTTPPDAWDELMDVNVRGAYLAARAALPAMLRQGAGVIVATSSDCAVRTCADSAAYVTSKHALIGLMRSIAVDFGARGIRANVVVPGVTETPGLHRWYSAEGHDPATGIAKAAAISPLGRIGQAREVAEAVAFLCSDRASFMTGAVLTVDGGMTVTYGAD
jgi:NAD(P)-dependent dehydrogenase (short-subunit alcohol dehydrogenase family)